CAMSRSSCLCCLSSSTAKSPIESDSSSNNPASICQRMDRGHQRMRKANTSWIHWSECQGAEWQGVKGARAKGDGMKNPTQNTAISYTYFDVDEGCRLAGEEAQDSACEFCGRILAASASAICRP